MRSQILSAVENNFMVKTTGKNTVSFLHYKKQRFFMIKLVKQV